MEIMSRLMPVLWQILKKHNKGAINVSTVDENLTVNILLGKKRKVFKSRDHGLVLVDIKRFASAL